MSEQRFGKAERDLLLGSLFLKVLLFPAYRSTDFEVHRNWLAITKSLPLREWYFEATSEWTLDYPPFFAYFEHALSTVAHLIDPQITRLSATPIATWSVIAFQRSSVIVSESVLACALYTYTRPSQPATRIVAASLFLHPGLLMVDSIHFQYNAMLLGLLLLSLIAVRKSNLPMCALYFAVLLNFKHIFMYLAPPFIVYLFRAHCFTASSSFQAHRLVQLGFIVGSVCLISFGPFLAVGGIKQLQQILSRLFPFQRGLNHAYWAGNVWAIYTAVDRILVKYLLYRGLPVAAEAVHSTSRGLIGDITFGVLPEVKPVHCFAVTIAINALFMLKLWFKPTHRNFLHAVTLSAFTSFLFGFHVHEKAILLILFPLSLLATERYEYYRVWLVTSAAGIAALFPLLIKPEESPLKLIYTAIWFAITVPLLSKNVMRPVPTSLTLLVEYAERLYLVALPLVLFLTMAVLPWYFRVPNYIDAAILASEKETEMDRPSMEFLPLMLTSVYCAIGILWAWIQLSYLYVANTGKHKL